MFFGTTKHSKERDRLKKEIAERSSKIRGYIKDKDAMITIMKEASLVAGRQGKIVKASPELTKKLGYDSLIGVHLKKIAPTITNAPGQYVFITEKGTGLELECQPLFRDEAVYCKVLL